MDRDPDADGWDGWADEWVRAVRSAMGAEPSPRPMAPPDTLGRVLDAPAVAACIDHTLLRPEATPDDVLRAAVEAKTHGFAGVCVNGWHLARVAQALAGTHVRPVCVVGFPLGAAVGTVKAAETARAVQDGAAEIDTVINLGALRAGRWQDALADLHGVVRAAAGRPVKVILETHLLSREHKVEGCVLAELAGASFVKTSTGFTGGGATVADVRLMRRAVGDRLAVKASGGIRSLESAQALLAAGARRLGCSSSVALIQEGKTGGGY